jgi:alkanesulfonate monooxygenase SsuD/methylene tetrahydromethanopterin reductase-like flavin-dependent oxidoreductase (luciferase family)
VHSQPKPVNRSIPIIVGGHSKAAARRAGRLGDGFFPARGASPELIDLVRRTAEENGRDPDAIEITASLPEDLDTIPALAASGVNRLLVPVLPMFGVAGIINSVDEVAPWADIIDKYRDI